MIKLFNLWFASTTMTGTVDITSGGKADVELVAQDGHYHEDSLPIWMFPCNVEEGTKFSIKISNDLMLIRCED